MCVCACARAILYTVVAYIHYSIVICSDGAILWRSIVSLILHCDCKHALFERLKLRDHFEEALCLLNLTLESVVWKKAQARCQLVASCAHPAQPGTVSRMLGFVQKFLFYSLTLFIRDMATGPILSFSIRTSG